MNEQEIEGDRKDRIADARHEIEAILKKYQLELVAEDMIGQTTKLAMMVSFRDLKDYSKAIIAQPKNPLVGMDGKKLK